jgi:GNAT superfamily N-acetyltransferase
MPLPKNSLPVSIRRGVSRANLTRLQAACLPGDLSVECFDFAWGAYSGRQCVGFVGFGRWADDLFYLERAAVLPAHAGRGVYRRLLRAALRGLPSGYAVTYTALQNHGSSNGLIAAGFRLYEPTVRWGFPDALYWRRHTKDKT